MCALPLWALLRWRLAVAWMPFQGGRERRLVGERVSRWLMPDLWALRHKRRLAERAERIRAKAEAERTEAFRALANIKVDKEGW
jgi:hypothetical protein